jgi:hypothetical protein
MDRGDSNEIVTDRGESNMGRGGLEPPPNRCRYNKGGPLEHPLEKFMSWLHVKITWSKI